MSEELTTPFKGLNDTAITGDQYLKEVQQFRDETRERKHYWETSLLGRRMVLSSDPDAHGPNLSI
jgi:hypothetical protein